jgi:cysteine desulfurase
MDRVIYLDNNATTRVAPEVVEAMLPFLTDRYGNPSSIHRFGGLVRKNIDRARQQVATLIGARPQEIYFTGSGSESNNTVLSGFFRLHRHATTLVTSTVEHPAVRNVCFSLREDGARLVEINVDSEGMLQTGEFERVDIDTDTLVSIMWANNETGMLFPVPEIAEKAKEKGALVHTDAVQAVGKIPIDLRKTPLDFLSLSGHKLHAPKGIGALFIREGAKVPPLIIGGHQEDGLRAGTENVASIVGLGKACELAASLMDEENGKVRRLRDTLEHGLLERCTGAKLNGHPTQRLPNTTNISFEFIEGEAVLLMLDEKGVAASSGSACTSGSLEPSHVMRAMGIPYTLAHSSTRFSLSRYTTEAEIEYVLAEMPSIVETLRRLSPYVQTEPPPE